MHSNGAFVITFLNFRSPFFALGQNKETDASRSPLSWQHMHDLSICQILLPETLKYVSVQLGDSKNFEIQDSCLQIAYTTSNAGEARNRLGDTARILQDVNHWCYLALVTNSAHHLVAAPISGSGNRYKTHHQQPLHGTTIERTMTERKPPFSFLYRTLKASHLHFDFWPNPYPAGQQQLDITKWPIR